jgi:predicted nucleic-acid-binding protein
MGIAIDTNILVRFLTHDDEVQYQQAYTLFQRPHLYVATTVFLETEWVLRYAYKYDASDIIRAFRMVLGLPNIEAEDAGRLASALTWHQAGMDFADALHLASSQECAMLYTFDREFVKKGKNISVCEVKELGKTP